jgi:exosortase/archaeosortase family protein
MEKPTRKIISIFSRYLLIILLGLFNLKIFYLILSPLTTYGAYIILEIFSSPSLAGNIISLNGQNFEIINACVVGAAYYLLIILFLSFQKIKLKTRVYTILTSFATLYILNITRIVFLISIAQNQYFEQIHWIFWNITSTIFVLLIFFLTIKGYKIKEIPFVEDVKYFWKLIKK